jgi:hypothetical protein
LGLLLHFNKKAFKLSNKAVCAALGVFRHTLINHANRWAANSAGGQSEGLLKAAAENYTQTWTAAWPELFGAPSAAPLDPLFTQWLPVKAILDGLTMTRRKGLMRTTMMLYRKHTTANGSTCTWPAAYAATRAAFAALGTSDVTVDVEHVAKLAKHGQPGDRSHGRPTRIPLHLEAELAWVVDHTRSKNGPIYKEVIMAQMTKSLTALGDSNPYPSSTHPKGVPPHWYNRFLKRHGLESFNEIPLDVNRAAYLKSDWMFQAYRNVWTRALDVGMADRHPDYVSHELTPNIPPIIWRAGELHRGWEFDEAGFDTGIKTAETPKTNGEKCVRRKGSKNAEVMRDGVSGGHVSGILMINFAAENMMHGFVADCGEGAALGKHGLVDDDGKPFTIPIPDGHGGMTEREVFFDCNDKGSFDAAMLLRFLKAMLQTYTRQGRILTAEAPALLVIDGCQTHLCKEIINWCIANHINIVLKLPYGSSLMQSMDAKGGHFSVIKPAYRKKVRLRCLQLMIAHANATVLQRLAGVGSGAGKLSLKEFVPALKAAWLKACTPERHKIALRTTGLVPFTMAPAFELQIREEARRVEGLGVPRPVASNAEIAAAIKSMEAAVVEHFTYVGGAPKGTKRKAEEIAQRWAAAAPAPVAVVAQVGAVAPAVPDAVAAARARVAAEIAAIKESGVEFDAEGIGRRVAATNVFKSDDEAGFAAGKAVLDLYPGLEADDREVLLKAATMERKNVGFWTARSGFVFKKCHANPTGTTHRAWLAAGDASKAAVAAFKAAKSAVRAGKAAAAGASEEAVSAAAVAELKTTDWSESVIKKLNKDKLAAVLRCQFKHSYVKRSGTGASKAELVAKLVAAAAHAAQQSEDIGLAKRVHIEADGGDGGDGDDGDDEDDDE